ncbi:hypothetical protein ZB36_24450 [Salmonella enterica subsp. enterica]|nr:hypothetical protein [Salmonella enterica subsp. enterica serovar Sandiego]
MLYRTTYKYYKLSRMIIMIIPCIEIRAYRKRLTATRTAIDSVISSAVKGIGEITTPYPPERNGEAVWFLLAGFSFACVFVQRQQVKKRA